MDFKSEILRECKKEIVCKYLGDKSFKLKHTDYLKLSEEIFEATGTSISISTLRRIFNEDFSGYPQISTLDAFAKYIGYPDWKTYVKDHASSEIHEHGSSRKKLRVGRKLIYGIAGAVILALMLYLLYGRSNISEVGYDNIEFSCYDFNHTEMPVIVYFKYDLKDIECDSASIQPLGYAGGDEFNIDVSDSIASYSYLWPETFNAKLAVDGKPVKNLIIRLVTNSWKAALSNTKDGFYVKYFDDKEIYSGGKMAFSDNVLKSNHFSTEDIEATSYHLYKDFTVDGDSLHFETRIKCSPLERTENSGNLSLSLYFEKASIHLPVALVKSIEKHLNLHVFYQDFSSKNTNLSGLYTNLENWNLLGMETADRTFRLSLNDSLVFETQYDTNPGKLIGIRYVFNGMGEVDYVRFSSQAGKLIEGYEFD